MERNNVSQWLNLNKLSLNVNKTKEMAFHMPQKKITQHNIQINGSNIEFVKNVVFLGTVEPLSNDHPHQRLSLLYDHMLGDGQCFLFV